MSGLVEGGGLGGPSSGSRGPLVPGPVGGGVP